MQVINLTPHVIRVYTDDQIIGIEPSGTVARVSARTLVDQTIEIQGASVPLCVQRIGEVVGLPEPQPDTLYLVSAMVINALQESGITRPDLISPGTGQSQGPIRDPNGNISGVTCFVRRGN